MMDKLAIPGDWSSCRLGGCYQGKLCQKPETCQARNKNVMTEVIWNATNKGVGRI